MVAHFSQYIFSFWLESPRFHILSRIVSGQGRRKTRKPQCLVVEFIGRIREEEDKIEEDNEGHFSDDNS